MSYRNPAGGGVKSYLVSFGDTRLGISICRFKQQAESLGAFDNIFIYTEASLPLEFVEYFKNKFYRINETGERLTHAWFWVLVLEAQSDFNGIGANPNGRFADLLRYRL